MSPAAVVRADIAALELAPGAFDAVTAFYSLIHVSRDRQTALFRRIHTWLRPGGLFLASLSAGGGADTVEDWLGVPMFFSGFDADTNRVLLADAGFAPLFDELVTVREPEGNVAFHRVLARRTEADGPKPTRRPPAAENPLTAP